MLVATLTVVVKLATVFKDISIAKVFGVGDDLDAFLLALVLPMFAISVFAGSFYAAFIPTFIHVQDAKTPDEAKRLFANVLLMVVVTLASISSLTYLNSNWLISWFAAGFSPGKAKLSAQIFTQLSPLIVIGGLSVFGNSILNSQKKFALAALSPALTPLVIVFLLHFFVSPRNVQLLIQGTLLGALLELMFVSYGLYRAGFLIPPKWSGLDQDTRKVVTQYLPMIGGTFLMSGTTVIDQVMASWLSPGSVSALSYGNKIPSFISGLAASALGVVVLPYFSRQSAAGDFIGLKKSLSIYSRLTLLYSIPLVVLFFLFSDQIVGMVFERGSFNKSNTIIVSEVFKFSLWQVPFYVMGILFARAATVLCGTRILLYTAMMNIILNITLNYLFMNLFGVKGIALSTVLVYFSSSMTLLYFINKKYKEIILEV